MSGKIWRWAAGLFVFINLAGLVYAARMGEEAHGLTHLSLLLLGLVGYAGWRFGRRGKPQDLAQVQLAERRIEYLQQSIDAMALELERVGEAQRFSDKLRVERGETPPQKKSQ